MDTFLYIFISVMAVLGSIVIGNDVAMFAHVRMHWPFWLTFAAFVAIELVGAGIAWRFDRLFWYGGIIALIGASYSISALGLPR